MILMQQQRKRKETKIKTKSQRWINDQHNQNTMLENWKIKQNKNKMAQKKTQQPRKSAKHQSQKRSLSFPAFHRNWFGIGYIFIFMFIERMCWNRAKTHKSKQTQPKIVYEIIFLFVRSFVCMARGMVWCGVVAVVSLSFFSSVSAWSCWFKMANRIYFMRMLFSYNCLRSLFFLLFFFKFNRFDYLKCKHQPICATAKQ